VDPGTVDPAAYLPGSWRVERTLHDAELGDGRFDGTATFTPDGGALAWSETGRLRLAGYDGPARRALRIVPGPDGWEVRFADGRPFHRLELGPATAPVEHLCREDLYTGVYAVEGHDAFSVRWRVRGPAKDQRLAGRYVRL
jgi:hypothetical protein